jgi:hypothetical protein
LKRRLESVPIDRDAEDRAWQVVRAAYAEHRPVRRRTPRIALALAALAVAVTAAVLSPTGRAVVDAVRRTIGVDHAAPAIFRLPAPGRLLVSGPGGAWVVSADGSTRRLGDWTQASWSPHERFVVVASRNELAAVEPDGTVHWTLARPRVSLPRWGGSRTDTRIAYLSGNILRVVSGAGTGDRAIGPARHVAPRWRPGSGHVLEYVDRAGRLVALDVDRNAVVSRTPYRPRPTHAAIRGNSVYLDGERLFTAPGRLSGLAGSPNGRWLVTTLPAADQLIFVGPRVLAVSNIRAQFGGPISLDGWASSP